MQTGMLWFDNSDQRDLEAKLRRAATYYENKYGRHPTVCYAHPSMLIGAPASLSGIRLQPSNVVLPQHLWIGEGEEREARPAA